MQMKGCGAQAFAGDGQAGRGTPGFHDKGTEAGADGQRSAECTHWLGFSCPPGFWFLSLSDKFGVGLHYRRGPVLWSSVLIILCCGFQILFFKKCML